MQALDPIEEYVDAELKLELIITALTYDPGGVVLGGQRHSKHMRKCLAERGRSHGRIIGGS